RGGDHRLGHGRVAAERGLDLAELDAEAPHLDLVVEPAEELQRAVGAPARQVAGAVEALARGAEGVGHEALGGQLRPPEGSREPAAARGAVRLPASAQVE